MGLKHSIDNALAKIYFAKHGCDADGKVIPPTELTNADKVHYASRSQPPPEDAQQEHMWLSQSMFCGIQCPGCEGYYANTGPPDTKQCSTKWIVKDRPGFWLYCAEKGCEDQKMGNMWTLNVNDVVEMKIYDLFIKSYVGDEADKLSCPKCERKETKRCIGKRCVDDVELDLRLNDKKKKLEKKKSELRDIYKEESKANSKDTDEEKAKKASKKVLTEEEKAEEVQNILKYLKKKEFETEFSFKEEEKREESEALCETLINTCSVGIRALKDQIKNNHLEIDGHRRAFKDTHALLNKLNFIQYGLYRRRVPGKRFENELQPLFAKYSITLIKERISELALQDYAAVGKLGPAEFIPQNVRRLLVLERLLRPNVRS